jgi:hypothetical protein
VSKARVTWEGEQDVLRRMSEYENKVYGAIREVADYFQPIIEAYAKQNASWTDRSGNARQALHSFVEDVSKEAVALYIAHGMDYGIWLEVRWAGKYAILLPTLEAHYGEIGKMLKGIFG